MKGCSGESADGLAKMFQTPVQLYQALKSCHKGAQRENLLVRGRLEGLKQENVSIDKLKEMGLSLGMKP